ncbi:MAG: histidine kinase [Bacteroidales bacterium]|nr:histidine kinase [Bacteroidales bacterium]MCF8457900.1 histidine kinase [Bacteroidales bacterium]
MVHLIQKKSYYRLAVVLIAIASKLLLDVVYSLMYRNQPLFDSTIYYLYAIIFAFAVFEALRKINYWFDKRVPWDSNFQQRLFLELLANAFVAIIILMAFRFIYIYMFWRTGFSPLLDEFIRAIIVVLMISILVFGEMGVVLLNRWRLSLAELEKFKKENIQVQFEMLRTQINPHFLFNSFNTLSSLIYEDKDKASEFIREMSDVYRYTLENRQAEKVPLSEEMNLIRAYIRLLEIRFESKISFDIKINESHLKKEIAPMSLQLLVENCVKHNVVSADKPLRVSIYSEDEYLVISNPKQPKRVKEYSSKIGLKNIQGRYRMLSKLPVIIDDAGLNFVVKIPLI